MLNRVCYKWVYPDEPAVPECHIKLGMMNQQWDKPNPIRSITTAHLNYSPYNQSLSAITLVFPFHHSLSRLPFSFIGCILLLLHVICRNLPFLFVTNIFIRFSFCRLCLRSINHLRICSTNSHLGFLSKRHYLSSITSILLFLITTINGYVPEIIFYGQMTLLVQLNTPFCDVKYFKVTIYIHSFYHRLDNLHITGTKSTVYKWLTYFQ